MASAGITWVQLGCRRFYELRDNLCLGWVETGMAGLGQSSQVSGHSLFVVRRQLRAATLVVRVDAACLNKLPFIETGEDGNQDLYSRVAGPALTLRPVKFLGMVSRSSTEQLRPKGEANASGDLSPRDGELRY